MPVAFTAPAFALSVREAGQGDVYNLTVEEDHEYFANGILVSNCDAERYIIGYLKRGQVEFAPNSPGSKNLMAQAPRGVFGR